MDRQLKRRIVLGVTTGGLLAGGGLGLAHADTAAGGGTAGGTHGSPGILSGNSVQIPVDIPINVCGVTASVIGVLNPAAGNDCSNSGGAVATTGSAQWARTGAATTGAATTTGTAAANTGTTSGGGATAHGGAHGSPGIVSGNNVQIPVNVPVNACGDSVSGVGVGDAALDNHCRNAGGGAAAAHGGASGSPGILSGNNVQVPVDVPVNACGDTVSVVGVLDSAIGNHCANGGPATPPWTPPGTPPSTPGSPPPPPPSTTPATPGTPTPTGGTTGQVGGETPGSTGTLAHTGAEGLMLGPVGAALAGGGAVLYRRARRTGSH